MGKFDATAEIITTLTGSEDAQKRSRQHEIHCPRQCQQGNRVNALFISHPYSKLFPQKKERGRGCPCSYVYAIPAFMRLLRRVHRKPTSQDDMRRASVALRREKTPDDDLRPHPGDAG
jgi:hypothetical protein